MSINLIVDHDAGTNPDDCLAFLLLSRIPNIRVLATISGNRFPMERAVLAHRFCSTVGIRCPHFPGSSIGCVDFFNHKQIENYSATLGENFVEEISSIVSKQPHVTYLAIQGLTNLKHLLDAEPTLKRKLSVVHLGLSTNDFDDWTDGGTNMRADSLAAKAVYSNPEIQIRSIGLQTTLNDALRLRPDTAVYQWLQTDSSESSILLREQLEEFRSRRGIWPALHDPLAAAVAAEAFSVMFEKVSVEFGADGHYKRSGPVSVTTSKPLASPENFFDWFSRTVMQ